MGQEKLHRFIANDRRYALDPDTCFCFECDESSWDVLEYYPGNTPNAIVCALEGRQEKKVVEEVVSELEWLRAIKSILRTPKQEEIIKRFEVPAGIKDLYLRWPVAENGAAEAVMPQEASRGLASMFRSRFGEKKAPGSLSGESSAMLLLDQASNLLLARAAHQQELQFRIGFSRPEAVRRFLDEGGLERLERWRQMALCSGKQVTLSLGLEAIGASGLSESPAGHELEFWIDGRLGKEPLAVGEITAFLTMRADKWGGAPAAFAKLAPAFTGRVVFRPMHADFGGAVKALHQAGFLRMDLDLDDAFDAPGADPAALMEGLRANAEAYAEALLKGDLYRVEPMASLFLRIYHGTAEFRNDPAGVHHLAVNEAGEIYPAKGFFGRSDFMLGKLGAVIIGIDEEKRKRFEDVGSLTTSACLRCWARGLCGGGTAAVHERLSGNFRTPHEAWCTAQRRWIEGAVAAFNTLSSAGVNFTRLHDSLAKRPRLSILTMAKAAVQLRLSLRPVDEADAEWLTRWENWNDAAYFTFNESGLMLATRYDREMDALHPRVYEQEYIITHRNGKAAGLVKFRNGLLPGTAWAWLYFRREADYAASGVRSSLRMLLGEMLKERAMKTLFIPVGPKDKGLADCLTAVGFRPAGVLREALYLHGRYHDVALYAVETASKGD